MLVNNFSVNKYFNHLTKATVQIKVDFANKSLLIAKICVRGGKAFNCFENMEVYAISDPL